jgi:hypothetical protein
MARNPQTSRDRLPESAVFALLATSAHSNPCCREEKHDFPLLSVQTGEDGSCIQWNEAMSTIRRLLGEGGGEGGRPRAFEDHPRHQE